MDALKSKGQMLDQINLENIPRSGFDLSFNNKGTGKIGRIIPTRCTETLPGDSFKGSTQAALQFEPLAVPILSNMNVRQETWYVPNHILLDNWDTLISKGEDLSDNSVVPSFSLYDVFYNIFRLIFKNNNEYLPDLYIYVCPFFENGVQSDNAYFNLYDLISYASKIKEFALNASSDPDKVAEVDLLSYIITYCDNYISTLNSQIDSFYGIYASKGDEDYIGVGVPVYAGYSYNNHSYAHFIPFNQFSLEHFASYFSSDDLYIKDKLLSEYDDCNLFSTYSIDFIRFLYDLCSPFIGVSSQLDYLGYPIISFTDWLFFFYGSLDCFGRIVVPTIPSYTKNSFIIVDIFDNGDDFISNSQFSVLPLRACYAIWYNNYRDKLLETNAFVPSTLNEVSYAELRALIYLRVRCWSKDTFNTSLANTGTGNMVVPISQNLGGNRTLFSFPAKSDEEILDLGLTSYDLSDGTKIDLPTRYLSKNHSSVTSDVNVKYEFSLDTLRRAGRTEKWIQKALIYGNLIQDSLYTHWGVKIKNERIQLPEFVSSSSQLVQINALVNNTSTDQQIAGSRTGFASAYDNGGTFDFYCPENGFLISFLTVLPQQSYAYGSPRHLSKLRIFDYAFPEFAQIGMDAVYNSEIRNNGMSIFNEFMNGVFGYQGRYYDYKCKQDEEHGELRTTQDMYTFAKDYNPYNVDSLPKLNYIFAHCWPSLDMFVTDDPLADLFRFDLHHSVAASRALPVCGLSV